MPPPEASPSAPASPRPAALGLALAFGGGAGGERLTALWRVSLALWLAALIATPISLWLAGERAFPLMATLGVLAQASATLVALAGRWPARRVLGVAALVAVGTWAVEWLGSTTGFPFGHYEYTGMLQPQAGGVPLLIPLAWLMMLAPAWAAADALLAPLRERLGRWYPAVYAALAGAAFAAWDLFLDPQMVARGLWVWDSPGGYFGIPWINFVGWWLTAALLTLLARPADLPRPRLLAIYTLTWLFQTVGLGVFWGQPGPALVGFAAMGLFAALAWRAEARRWRS